MARPPACVMTLSYSSLTMNFRSSFMSSLRRAARFLELLRSALSLGLHDRELVTHLLDLVQDGLLFGPVRRAQVLRAFEGHVLEHVGQPRIPGDGVHTSHSEGDVPGESGRSPRGASTKVMPLGSWKASASSWKRIGWPGGDVFVGLAARRAVVHSNTPRTSPQETFFMQASLDRLKSQITPLRPERRAHGRGRRGTPGSSAFQWLRRSGRCHKLWRRGPRRGQGRPTCDAPQLTSLLECCQDVRRVARG